MKIEQRISGPHWILSIVPISIIQCSKFLLRKNLVEAGEIELFLQLIDIMMNYYNQKYAGPHKFPRSLGIGFRY